MSKFFVQLLLSVIVGVGAALGYSPDSKAEFHEAWQDAKISLDDVVHGVGKVSDLAAGISTAVSVKADVKTSTGSDENADVKLNGNLNAKVSHEHSLVENLLPGFLLRGSSTDESRTNAEAETLDLNTELNSKIKSTLNLDSDTGE